MEKIRAISFVPLVMKKNKIKKAAKKFSYIAPKWDVNILGPKPRYGAARLGICFQCLAQSRVSRGIDLPTGPDGFNVTHQILSQANAKYLQ